MTGDLSGIGGMKREHICLSDLEKRAFVQRLQLRYYWQLQCAWDVARVLAFSFQLNDKHFPCASSLVQPD
jgi:hypothetical protein